MADPTESLRRYFLSGGQPPAAAPAAGPSPAERERILKLAQEEYVRNQMLQAQARQTGQGEGIGQAWNEQTSGPLPQAQETQQGVGEGMAQAQTQVRPSVPYLTGTPGVDRAIAPVTNRLPDAAMRALQPQSVSVVTGRPGVDRAIAPVTQYAPAPVMRAIQGPRAAEPLPTMQIPQRTQPPIVNEGTPVVTIPPVEIVSKEKRK